MPMRRMHRILDSVGATQGQREQIRAIWTGLQPQLRAERTQHKNLRQQMVAALTAPTINAGEVERLRKLSMASADKTSALITQGMMASAQVLTPDQRKQAQAELAKGRGHHRGEPHAD
jgi:Spy/CpxP family protein refolding chaperone